jgi:putative methyltransferase (TIGR04325 family)
MPPNLAGVVKSAVRHVMPRSFLESRYERYFFGTPEWKNLHLGVFESFEEADAFAAARGVHPHFGLDHEKWLREHRGLSAHDYPMLFWLSHLVCEDARVVDLGGSVGVSYYAYKAVRPFPPTLHWRVCELGEVVPLGQRIARERGETALSFTTDLSAIDGASILFAAGVLQYVRSTLAELLDAVSTPPRHVLINRLPLTTQRGSFVTLQNGGAGIQSYRVDNEGEFLQELQRSGYRVVDRWRCLENATEIPFHPELTLDHFSGFYLTRDSE